MLLLVNITVITIDIYVVDKINVDIVIYVTINIHYLIITITSHLSDQRGITNIRITIELGLNT